MVHPLRQGLHRIGPNSLLVGAAAAEILIESVRVRTGSTTWLLVEAMVALAALGFAWKEQERIRLAPVVLVAIGLPAGVIAIHAHLGVTGDQDVQAYAAYGNELLHGTYPQAEYPVGAVLLFAFEAVFGSVETANELLMVPFQLVSVIAIWSLRTRRSGWLAAVVAIWPMSTYYWLYRFDLVPAALIVVGLLLAYRGRWGWSGGTLGAGAAVKWVPALPLLVLAVWLAARVRFRDATRLVAAFVAVFAAVNVPFLLWEPARMIDTYRGQAARGITNESIWFFPLSLLGLTGDDHRVWAPAGAPHWADVTVTAVQVLLLLVLAGVAAKSPGRRQAVALAALAPVIFLLTNRVFSPQFLLVLTAALAFAGALVLIHRREQLILGLLLMAATFANAFVYPFRAPFDVASWRPFSLVVFAALVAATGGVFVRAIRPRTSDVMDASEPEPESVGNAIRSGRAAVAAATQRASTAPLPRWASQTLRWLPLALGLVVAVPTLFAALVLPYRYWDSLAFGAWSRSIWLTGDLWANSGPTDITRPLFYIAQGFTWRALGYEVWLGRLLSGLFGVVLAAAVWSLAGHLARDRDATRFLRAFSIAVLLSSSVFASLVIAGMTDVPVAAATAATGAAALPLRRTSTSLVLTALGAAAMVLAKPSGLLALAGLVPAILLLRRHRALPALAGCAIGAGAALLYDSWQASRLDMSLPALLRSGNEGFWLERGAAARWDALERAEWLGAGLRLVVLFGLVHAIARVAGARPRTALAGAAIAAVSWSVAGPLVADDHVTYPFQSSGPAIAVWLVLVAAMTVAPLVAAEDPVNRRTYAALLVWASPTALAWFLQRADEVRHLAPAWPAFILLTAAGLTSLSLALARLHPASALVPIGSMLVLTLATLVTIDGLGRSGWRGLLELGPSGWRSRATVENFAYGPFSYELNLARENVPRSGGVVSSDGRLRYFFPERTEVAYPSSCSQVASARFFSFLMSGESLQFSQLRDQPTDPLGWLQCRKPRLRLIGEQPGIYAAFVVGRPPQRAPTPADCHISSLPGTDVDGVFGRGLSYGQARQLDEQALARGFRGTRIERTGCSTFRVVVTGIPEDRRVQEDFRREVEGVELSVEFEPALRFPEVSPNVSPLR